MSRNVAPTTLRMAISFVFLRMVNEIKANIPVAVNNNEMIENQKKMVAILSFTFCASAAKSSSKNPLKGFIGNKVVHLAKWVLW